MNRRDVKAMLQHGGEMPMSGNGNGNSPKQRTSTSPVSSRSPPSSAATTTPVSTDTMNLRPAPNPPTETILRPAPNPPPAAATTTTPTEIPPSVPEIISPPSNQNGNSHQQVPTITRKAAPAPPQQQQQQQLPRKGSMGGGGAEQMTFEVANSSAASIVKPILPQNVLGEMQSLLGGRGITAPTTTITTTTPAPPPPPVIETPRPQPQPQPQQPTQDDEKQKLIKQVEQHLREQGKLGVTLTVGELSGQIKALTGQSWGGHWEGKFGPLAPFLKQHPNHFSVVRNKYVVAKGMEDLVSRQLDRDAQAASMMAEEQNRTRQLNSSVAMMDMLGNAPPVLSGFNDPSLYYTPAPPQQQQPTYDTSYQWGTQPNEYDRRLSRVDSAEWIMPQANYDVSAVGPPMDTFAPLVSDTFGETWMNPNPDAWAADDGWDMTFQPSFLPNTTVVAGDDWWSQPTPQNPPPPPVIQPPAKPSRPAKSDEDDAAMARRVAAKKQQQEDEALARKLQEAEFRSNGITSATEWIVLTTAEMRELAEKELGKDNVRIIAGFTVRKFGREGRPHQRKMWVTQSLTHLAWASSLLEGSHRGIELKHVTSVVPGQMTATIARSTSDREKVRAFCLSLVTQSRTLDLQACSVVQRNALVDALTAVVAFNKKYSPERVDRDLTRVQLTGFATLFKPTNGNSSMQGSKRKGNGM